jgi:hypothetical protein
MKNKQRIISPQLTSFFHNKQRDGNRKKFEFAARRRFGSNKYYDDNDNFLGGLDE